MFKLESFDIEHAKVLLQEPMNQHLSFWCEQDYKFTRNLARNSDCFTGKVGDEVVGAIFIVEVWTGRGYVVTLLSEKIREHSVAVYRGMKAFLHRKHHFRRLEFDIPVGFELGQRRAKFMGFEPMGGVAKKYLPDGNDAEVYAWVRD